MPEDPSSLVVATAEEVVAANAERTERLALLLRRMRLALYDCDLSKIVGINWVRIGDDGLEFGPLTFRQSDALLRYLEDIGRGVRPVVSSCHDQLSLF